VISRALKFALMPRPVALPVVAAPMPEIAGS